MQVADPLSVLAISGALQAEDYRALLSVPYSLLHTGIRGWISLLESVVSGIGIPRYCTIIWDNTVKIRDHKLFLTPEAKVKKRGR